MKTPENFAARKKHLITRLKLAWKNNPASAPELIQKILHLKLRGIPGKKI